MTTCIKRELHYRPHNPPTPFMVFSITYNICEKGLNQMFGGFKVSCPLIAIVRLVINIRGTQVTILSESLSTL